MKRIAELRQLSDDHHQGLVLAQKAKRAGDSENVSEVWAEVETRFKDELEPHFEVEETCIAPVLVKYGEQALVRRLHKEHSALRQFVLPQTQRTAEALKRFGTLLEQHIRFEERELFEVAQKVFTPAELAAVAEAHKLTPKP